MMVTIKLLQNQYMYNNSLLYSNVPGMENDLTDGFISTGLISIISGVTRDVAGGVTGARGMTGGMAGEKTGGMARGTTGGGTASGHDR